MSKEIRFIVKEVMRLKYKTNLFIFIVKEY